MADSGLQIREGVEDNGGDYGAWKPQGDVDLHTPQGKRS